MEIQFESVQFTADQELLDHITKRLTKLNQFHDKIISCSVTLKLGAAEQVRDKIMEVRIAVPGDVIFGKKVDKTFEGALNELMNPLRRQLKRRKDIERTY